MEQSHHSKKWKKQWFKSMLAIGSFVGISGAIAGLVSYKSTHKFHAAFYNYKSYMSNANKAILNETYEYKEFDEIIQFSRAIINHKAIAGIGSDFQAVTLAKQGLIKKMDFQKLFHLDFKPTQEQVKTILKATYSPIVWDHLESYDAQLNEGNTSAVQNHLWEYMIPYYVQDIVVGINPTKFNPQKEPDKFPFDSEKSTDEVLRSNSKFLTQQRKQKIDPYSLFNILNTLFKQESIQKDMRSTIKHLTITDAIRNNMILGTSYQNKEPISLLDSTKENHSKYGELVTPENYKSFIEDFISLIEDASGYKLNDTSHITLNPDGLKLLTELISDPSSGLSPSDAAIMFNGDALDAWYSSDNTDDQVPDQTIRVIRPSTNLLLLDGIILSEGVSENTENQFYQSLSNSFLKNFDGLWTEYKALLSKNNTSDSWSYDQNLRNQAMQNYSAKFYTQYLDQLVKNIEFDLNEQQEWQELKKVLIQTYLSSLENDRFLTEFVDIYQQMFNNLDPQLNLLAQKIVFNNVDSSTEIQLKTDHDQYLTKAINLFGKVDFANDQYASFFEENYTNLENFDNINYTPSLFSEFEIVRRNYFIDEDNVVDKRAIDIYTVKNHLVINNQVLDIAHPSINVVDIKTRTDIENYYYKMTKQ